MVLEAQAVPHFGEPLDAVIRVRGVGREVRSVDRADGSTAGALPTTSLVLSMRPPAKLSDEQFLAFHLATISFGVPAGAMNPHQV